MNHTQRRKGIPNESEPCAAGIGPDERFELSRSWDAATALGKTARHGTPSLRDQALGLAEIFADTGSICVIRG